MVMRVGHRGARGHAPENTISSIKKAIELNADMVEIDVRLCRSGELVLMHDSKIDRTTNGKGYVSRKSLNVLKEFDAGNGEKIPTLNEVLDILDKRVKVNIELKGSNTAKPTNRIIKAYIKHHGWKSTDFFVSSFKHKELKKLKEINPAIMVGALVKRAPRKLEKLFFADAINFYVKTIRKSKVRKTKKLGKKVFVWSVNKKSSIEKMKRWEVDAIISDYPDII